MKTRVANDKGKAQRTATQEDHTKQTEVGSPCARTFSLAGVEIARRRAYAHTIPTCGTSVKFACHSLTVLTIVIKVMATDVATDVDVELRAVEERTGVVHRSTMLTATGSAEAENQNLPSPLIRPLVFKGMHRIAPP